MPERIVVTDTEGFSADPSLPKEITESIAIGNVKSVAEQSSMLSNLAYANAIANDNLSQQNAVANQQAINQIGVTVLGKTVNLVSALQPLEAVSTSVVLTGNAVAEELIDIIGAGQVTQA